ncbi:hypothetical protein EAF04_004549 [Stromatinia cepivora]|nr:hypothetical protein EAF04_004549 [Stromatinia cepivora]
MATPRGSKQRSHLPTPPISPDQFQTPRPLPLPTEMSRLKSWKTARSRSLDILKNEPATPTPLRVVSDPVITTISNQITSYDQSSSPEQVTESEVEANMPNRYTTSYYNILGLPESPNVTTKDIEDAYNNLVSNHPSDSNHSQETLQQIHKTLTNSIRRRTYDLGRRAHLLRQTHLVDRERFEKKMGSDFFHTEKSSSQEARAFVDKLRTDNLKRKMEILKRELAENVEKKIRVMGLSMNMDGMNEVEGVPWEEMDFGAKGAEPIGERLSLDFEFAGSGSEQDSEEENGSGGTFSDREEERGELETVEETKGIEEYKEVERLSVSAMAVPVLEATVSDLEKIPAIAENTSKDDERASVAKDDREGVVDIPGSTSKIDEATVKMHTETDLPNMETIIDLLFPTPTPTPVPKMKQKTVSHKEIWEFDYSSETDTEIDEDSDSDINTDTDTDNPPTNLQSSEPTYKNTNTKTNITITSNHEPQIHKSTPTTLTTPTKPLPFPSPTQPEPDAEPDAEPEIWESSYDDESEEENDATMLLSAKLLAAIWVVIAAWAWFGYVPVAA